MMRLQIIFGIVLLLLVSACGGGGGGGGGTPDTTAPLFTSMDTVYLQENKTTVMIITTEDNSTVSYTVSGGEDKDRFLLDSTSGVLRFVSAPDFEHPSDADLDNIYKIQIEATGSQGNSAWQELSVIVTDQDEIPPHFTSASTIVLKENHSSVLLLTSNDPSASYAVTGGEDASRFFLFSGSATLRFKSSPDFEHPADIGNDNHYILTVTATDTVGNYAEQEITVTITDINEGSNEDDDGDRIPNDIEILLESNLSDSDSNSNGIEDGLDTEGIYGDTFFDMQWHLWDPVARAVNYSGVDTQGDEGVTDLDLLDLYHTYMGYNKGDPIIVQVIDTGVDADHEDLVANMDLSRSYHGSAVGDPSSSATHGTMVAGIIAARAFNGKGVRGIAPFAKIAGSDWLNNQSSTTLEKVWLTGEGANEIALTNNSWGSDYDTNTLYETIMAQGSATLRDTKGRIYLFAAGNSRAQHIDANLQYMLSNRYPIVVAALKNSNTYADYSTPGANILVSGYSGNYYSDSPTIGTTTIMGTSNSDQTWVGDTAKNYTFAMNGTSAATPTVAGAIALLLEACPSLTWRDVRYLAAVHARQVDSTNSSWITNDAGLHHSRDYGFGRINPKAMIADCTSGYTLLSAETSQTVSKTFDTPIPDNNTSGIVFDLNITDAITTEWVETTIDSDTPQASDYKIIITSPLGTSVTLAAGDIGINGAWLNGGFRLSTPALMNEAAQGIWHVHISDTKSGNTGTLKSIQLRVYGH